MPFQIIRNDITQVKADAIVNTANPMPIVGSGTDSAVYKAAGEALLLAERRKIGNIAPGQAAYTHAYNLNAKYIIHTVGPEWIDGTRGEHDILRSCYRNTLEIAAQLNCESIAFPLLATGVYGFPKDEALQIALSEISTFLLGHDMQVILVVFDRDAFALSGRVVADIKAYIDEYAADSILKEEYGKGVDYIRQRRERSRIEAQSRAENRSKGTDGSRSEITLSSGLVGNSEKKLDDILVHTGATFQQRLLQLIDESGMSDVTVYKKANIDRKVFSKIRSREDYQPKKKTAVAFAIALQLDMETMKDLLARAGIAVSDSSRFDLIISYFVNRRIYDIYEINAALFQYGQPMLGSE